MKLLFVLALVIQATIILSVAPQDGNVYKIVAKNSGLVLGIPGNNNAVGADLVGFADQSSNYQRLMLHQASPNNIFYIQIVGSNLYVSNYVSPPRQAGFDPSAFYQDYEFIPAAEGYYMIRPVDNLTSVMTIAPDGSLSWQPQTGADNQLFFLCASSVIPSNGTVNLKLARFSVPMTSEGSSGLDLRS